MTPTVDVLGYRVYGGRLDTAVAWAMEQVRSRKATRMVACANPHSLYTAENDPAFAAALHGADLLLADGIGVVWAARLLAGSRIPKIAGFDFFQGMCSACQKQGGIRFFFLGASELVLEHIVGQMNRRFPAITVCGTFSPPFRTAFVGREARQMVEAVNRSRPDVLWVGMTAPKQEKWLAENRHLLQVPLAAAVGAVFDYVAGTRRRSADIWVRMGLEWLARLAGEPRRLWRRYLISSPLFVLRVLHAAATASRRPPRPGRRRP